MHITNKTIFLAPIVFHVFILISFVCCEDYEESYCFDLTSYWEQFKKFYGKEYDEEEECERRMLYNERMADIISHNIDYDLGKSTFYCGTNELSDYSDEEINYYFKGYKGDCDYKGNSTKFKRLGGANVPKEIDWRQKEMVTRIKNQGRCGSCWAFSSVGSLEGQYKKKSGDLVALSEQQLVDCSTNGPNNGCDGGLMSAAFDHLKADEGSVTEKSYPYTEKQGKCNFKSENIALKVTGYVEIDSGDEDDLKEAVGTQGPVSVAIDASPKTFMDYKGGIYDEPKCSSKKFDHAVLCVGYGSEDGSDYWLIKNSWGESWGIKGYMKMVRNKNMCGIASKASYPTIATS